jgi:hypothetical protein
MLCRLRGVGTSGAACFLGNKWRELTTGLGADESFLALVEVKKEQDEAALLVGLFKTSPQLEEFLDSSASPPAKELST